MIYLYGITDYSATPLPDISGLGDAPLLSLASRDVLAIYSRLVSSGGADILLATQDNLLKHEAVLEALMANCTVLPVQFGSVYSDESALEAALKDHHASFVSGLQRVRGKVELSLRVLWKDENRSQPATETLHQPDKESAPANGRAYLLARLQTQQADQVRRQHAEAMIATLKGSLDALCKESSFRILLDPFLSIKTSFLVEKEGVPAFCRAVKHQISTYPDLRFVLTGPWPPYNFVSICDEPFDRSLLQ